MKYLRRVARLNWWSGFFSALYIHLFVQDSMGREGYIEHITQGYWFNAPAWMWALFLIIMNIFVISLTNDVFSVTSKKNDSDENGSDSTQDPEIFV